MKAKKATVAQRWVGLPQAGDDAKTIERLNTEARSLAHLIARERRKERERCIAAVQFRADAWAEFYLTLRPSDPIRPNTERVLQEFNDIIGAINEGSQR